MSNDQGCYKKVILLEQKEQSNVLKDNNKDELVDRGKIFSSSPIVIVTAIYLVIITMLITMLITVVYTCILYSSHTPKYTPKYFIGE